MLGERSERALVVALLLVALVGDMTVWVGVGGCVGWLVDL